MQHQPALNFATSYQRLSGVERNFVDSFVAQITTQAQRAGLERVAVLEKLTTADVQFDQRTQNFLTFERVTSAIRERCTTLDYATAISQDRVRRELAALAFSSFENMVEIIPDGLGGSDVRLAPERWTAEQWAAVSEVVQEEQAQGGKRTFKVKLHPKIAALKMLGEHNGLFDPNNPHRVKETAREVVKQTEQAEFQKGTPLSSIQDAYARLLQRNAT